MSRGANRPPSQRQLRVGEEIRHALAWVLERGEVRDPGLEGRVVTVTEVRVSPDLTNATAFVVPLGGGDAMPMLDALRRAAPFLRHEIGRRVRLRQVPRLAFKADTSFDEAAHIDDLLHRPDVRRDLGGDAVGARGIAPMPPADGDEGNGGDGS